MLHYVIIFKYAAPLDFSGLVLCRICYVSVLKKKKTAKGQYKAPLLRFKKMQF